MAAKKKPAAEAAADTVEPVTGELIKFDGLSAERAPAIFGHNTLSDLVAKARAAVINEVPDLTSVKGRKRVASLAAEVSRSKTAVAELGVDYLRLLKAQPKVIEAELKKFREDMDALRDEVRAPLNAWEAAKAEAEAQLQAAVDQLVDRFTLDAETDAATLQQALTLLESEVLDEAVFGDRLEEAQQKRLYGIGLLTAQLSKRKQYESEQAELAEGRRKIAELEEQKRITAAAAQAVEDERKRVEEERQRLAHQQQLQRDEDARKVREAEQQRQESERLRLAAEQRLEDERVANEQRQQRAIEDERLRLENEQREQAEQQRRDDEARAANRAHCGAINKAALEALLAVNLAAEGNQPAHLNPDEAKAIITAIIRGQIPAVAITY